MKLIVGLGNHGAQYRFTRHNIGFLAVENLALRWGIRLVLKAFHSVYGKGVWSGEPVLLSLPQTYMNCSGQAVRESAAYFKIAPADIIVIHDELDFPFGAVRLKMAGGHGGHKGLLSIINELGTADFIRLRLGIGKPVGRETPEGGKTGESYVLEPFPKEQMPDLPQLLDLTVTMLESLLSEGLAPTMNRFHSGQ